MKRSVLKVPMMRVMTVRSFDDVFSFLLLVMDLFGVSSRCFVCVCFFMFCIHSTVGLYSMNQKLEVAQ
jgi:hypothetical protein